MSFYSKNVMIAWEKIKKYCQNDIMTTDIIITIIINFEILENKLHKNLLNNENKVIIITQR